MVDQTIPETAEGRRAPGRALAALPVLGSVLLHVALAVFAYAPLIQIDPAHTRDLTTELGDWIFLPSSGSALAVVVLSGWLLFRRRKQLRALAVPQGAAWPGLLLLAAGCAVLAWSLRTEAPDLLPISLILNGLGCAHVFWGGPGVRAVVLPVGFLAFALPLPAPLQNEVLYHLQIGTATYSGWLLQLAGQPALVSGIEILRPTTLFAVVEGCSGLRSMELLTLLVVLMLDLFGRRGWRALLIVALAAPLSFVLNGFRVVAVVILPQSRVDAVHTSEGIAAILVGLTLLFLLDGWLWRGSVAPKRAPAAPTPIGEARSRVRGLAATAAVAACAAMAAWLPPFALPGPELPILGAVVPETVGEWTSSRLRNDATLLERVRFHNNVHRRYSRGAESVDFFAAAGLHRRQRSAYSPKTALPAMGHAVEERGVAQLGPNGIDVDTLLLSRRGERSLVYHWYEHTNGFASEVIRAAVALDSSPWQRDRALVVLRMSTDAGDDDADLAEAALRLERFYTELNGVTSNPTL